MDIISLKGFSSNFRSLSFLLVVLFLSSCAPKAPPRISAPEEQSKKVLEDFALALKSLQKIQSARGYAKLKLKVKGRSANVDEAVLIQLPRSFRFETVDDFGGPRFLLLSDGESLFWRDFSRKEEGREDLSEAALKKYLPMAADLSETLGLFMGRIPRDDVATAKVSQEEGSGLYWILTPRSESLWDHEARTILSFASKGEDGKVAYQYKAGEFQGLIPRRIFLKDLKTNNEVTIHYLDFQLNPAIPRERFEVESSMKRSNDVD